MKIDDIMRLIQPLKIKLWTVVGRAKLLAVDNSGKVQRLRLQFTKDEVIEKIERLQEYGLESNPSVEDSSEVAYLSIGGQRGLTYAIKVQARALRPTGMTSGEVMLWSKHGQKIYLKADGSIDISAPGKDVKVSSCANLVVTADTKVTVTAPAVELSDGTVRQLIDERLVDAFNGHTHPTAGTGPPSTPTTPLVLANIATAKTKAG